MASNELLRAVVTCPHCKSLNQIIASGVQDHELVTCSHCHEVIDQWREIRMEKEPRSHAPDAGPDNQGHGRSAD